MCKLIIISDACMNFSKVLTGYALEILSLTRYKCCLLMRRFLYFLVTCLNAYMSHSAVNVREYRNKKSDPVDRCKLYTCSGSAPN
jgi:hypothetical protein